MWYQTPILVTNPPVPACRRSPGRGCSPSSRAAAPSPQHRASWPAVEIGHLRHLAHDLASWRASPSSSASLRTRRSGGGASGLPVPAKRVAELADRGDAARERWNARAPNHPRSAKPRPGCGRRRRVKKVQAWIASGSPATGAGSPAMRRSSAISVKQRTGALAEIVARPHFDRRRTAEARARTPHRGAHPALDRGRGRAARRRSAGGAPSRIAVDIPGHEQARLRRARRRDHHPVRESAGTPPASGGRAPWRTMTIASAPARSRSARSPPTRSGPAEGRCGSVKSRCCRSWATQATASPPISKGFEDKMKALPRTSRSSPRQRTSNGR